MASSYLAVEIPDDRLLWAIAEEAALNDATLDQLEREVVSPKTDAGRAAALALTIGRAGRPRSAAPLRATVARLEGAGRVLEAKAARLAIELLKLRPPKEVERAERGYRWRDPSSGLPGPELFIEDPLAAHWHHEERWGPPLRPEPDRPQVVAKHEGEVDRLARAAEDGEIVLVTFRPAGIFGQPDPPLRLMRAGLSRSASLEPMIRWSEISSVGAVERRWPTRRRAAAFEPAGRPEQALPLRPSIPTDDLVALMTRLLQRARA